MSCEVNSTALLESLFQIFPALIVRKPLIKIVLSQCFLSILFIGLHLKLLHTFKHTKPSLKQKNLASAVCSRIQRTNLQTLPHVCCLFLVGTAHCVALKPAAGCKVSKSVFFNNTFLILIFLYLAFLEYDGFLAVSCCFFPLARYGRLQSLAIVLCIFRDPPLCFSQQPGFFPFASAVCISKE